MNAKCADLKQTSSGSSQWFVYQSLRLNSEPVEFLAAAAACGLIKVHNFMSTLVKNWFIHIG